VIESLTPEDARRERRNSWIAAVAFSIFVPGMLLGPLCLSWMSGDTTFSAITVEAVETVCAIDMAVLP
jgi:hypothetical protein